MAAPAKGRFDRLIEETAALSEQDRAREEYIQLESDLTRARAVEVLLADMGLEEMANSIRRLVERVER